MEAKCGETYIQKLFAIESQADRLEYDYEQRLSLRQTESRKIIDEFYLCNFLKDGRIQLSSNLAEQSIKPFVIGRKNWLFSNTQNGANASAMIYSIIQTAIANDLKPMYYLEYVFEQIQLNPDSDQVSDFLPWSENIPTKCKNTKTLQRQ